MERFNRTKKPEEFTSDDLNYLKALLGTTRNVDGHDISFISILSIRELVILYNVTFDGIAVVAKVSIKYEILEPIECIIENLCFEEGIELEDKQWDQEQEKWLLTEKQNRQIYPKLKQAIETFKYTNTFIKGIKYEASVHECFHNCDTIPKYYGIYENEDIVIYVIEKLGPDLFHQKPSLEVVAIDIIKALQYIHNVNTHRYKSGYFHCDVTPGNILNNYRGGVCLIDFGLSMPIWACSKYSPDQKKNYSLMIGNHCYAPSVAFLGCYNYAADLEGLCYTLEYVYNGPDGFPWKVLAYEGEWRNDMSERAYLLRKRYVPSDERVKKLFEYIQTIDNEMPDYEKCIGFFM